MIRQDIKLDSNPGYPKELKGTPNWYLYINIHSYYELFTIAKRWKHPKCPSKGDWINKMWYTHTQVLFNHKKLWISNARVHAQSCPTLFNPIAHQAPLSRGFNSRTCYNMANLKTFCYREGARQKRTITLWFCLGWLKGLERWWWWLYNIVNVLNTTEFCTNRWFKWWNFMLCIFYHNFVLIRW